ncbi:hepatic lectin-like isoform X2 [Palaemon carinicauda]|uniref:hepatic lectin-like isoform X2 n=1 Tax=Palaemon carinicauda TaxID=392227 RepID=UPI0035B5B35A
MPTYSSFLFICVANALLLAVKGLSGEQDPTECPFPYTNIGGRCLYFHVLRTDTWDNMELICVDFNGQLAKVDDANLLYDIVNSINESGFEITRFWIGGTDKATEGDWRWVDNTEVKMGTPFWGTSSTTVPQAQEPNGGISQNCIGIDKDFLFLFHDFDCINQVSGGICEYVV